MGFRSLNQLCQDFQQRSNSSRERPERDGTTSAVSSSSSSAGQQHQAQCVGTLKKLFREKGFGFVAPDGGGAADVFLHFSDLASGGSEAMVAGMRVRYSGEVDSRTGKVRARNVAIVTPDGQGLTTAADVKQAVQKGVMPKEGGKGRSEKGRRKGKAGSEDADADAASPNVISAPPPPPPPPAAPRAYLREELLEAFDVLLAAGRLRTRPKALRIRTLQIPWACELELEEPKEKPRRRTPMTENPSLDDEARIAAMEARLSRESGADRKNFETFGAECSSEGWTFEEALKANSELSARWSAPQLQTDEPIEEKEEDYPDLPFEFEEEEEEDYEVQPWERGSRGGSVLQAALARKRSGGEDLELSTVACPESDFSGDLSSASESGPGDREMKDRGFSLEAPVSHIGGIQLQ